MPLAYGGGVKDVATAVKILSIGFEKIVLNTAAIDNPSLISALAEKSGVQSVIASIDVKKNMWGKYQVFSHDGTRKTSLAPVEWAVKLEQLGAGELLITSMDRDGTWSGYDIDLLKEITRSVSIPVIANGGAGSLAHIEQAIKQANVSAVALGSMVVYQAKDLGVLVNFPDKVLLERSLI
jgi:imidazole glycerol-phosphate synthase subunit HisF